MDYGKWIRSRQSLEANFWKQTFVTEAQSFPDGLLECNATSQYVFEIDFLLLPYIKTSDTEAVNIESEEIYFTAWKNGSTIWKHTMNIYSIHLFIQILGSIDRLQSI